jgi:hypothetical protein
MIEYEQESNADELLELELTDAETELENAGFPSLAAAVHRARKRLPAFERVIGNRVPDVPSGVVLELTQLTLPIGDCHA